MPRRYRQEDPERERGPTTRCRLPHTHVAHIAGLDGNQGEEEETDITDLGRLRRTGDGSQDISAADVIAEVTRQGAEIMWVAKTSSNLKGTYVKALKDAADYITTTWQNQGLQSVGPRENSGTAATRFADAKITALEKENTALRQKLSRRTACAHECPRCRGSASESDRPPREGKSENARLADLERRVEEIRPSIVRAIEERFGAIY
jgi:hypothetical protein